MKEPKLHHTLKELRKKKGISQKELAKVVGIDQSAVSKYERGVQLPELQIAMRISDYFDVTLDELIYSREFTAAEAYLTKEIEQGVSGEEIIKDNKYNFLDGVTKEELEKVAELIRVIKKESN